MTTELKQNPWTLASRATPDVIDAYVSGFGREFKDAEPEFLDTMRKVIADHLKGEVSAIEKYHNKKLTIRDIADKAIWMKSGFIAGWNGFGDCLASEFHNKLHYTK